MLDIFSGLRLVIKRRPINIDTAIFRFHWFLTSTILVSFSLIITARQYVGQPIECHSIDKIPETLLNSYCWVQSTFTVPQACNQRVGIDVPYPCIDNTRGREIKMFAYYQWVGIVLFIQGILFHLPYYLWKLWEAGLIRAITSGLRVAVLSDIERCKKKDIVIEYLYEHLGCHKRYALKYFLCELCCLINLLLQLWATDKFFDGQFLNYGLDVMRYSTGGSVSQPTSASNQKSTNSISSDRNSYTSHYQAIISTSSSSSSSSSSQQLSNSNNQTNPASTNSPRIDPMTFIFPRITKCTYYDFGSSGDIQRHDAICLLPLNIVNEKIYIALWFWFLILALLTSVVIVGRFFILFFKGVRAYFLRSRCKLSSETDLNIICQRGDVGDWFLFYMMASNLDPLIMREIVAVIAKRLEIGPEKEKEAMASYNNIIGSHHYDGEASSSGISSSSISRNRLTSSLTRLNDYREERYYPNLQVLRQDNSRETRSTSIAKPSVSLSRQLRNRLNLKGLFRGGRLFSLDNSITHHSLSSSQKKRLKRLNSWQGDQNHLFSGQGSGQDIENGPTPTPTPTNSNSLATTAFGATTTTFAKTNDNPISSNRIANTEHFTLSSTVSGSSLIHVASNTQSSSSNNHNGRVEIRLRNIPTKPENRLNKYTQLQQSSQDEISWNPSDIKASAPPASLSSNHSSPVIISTISHNNNGNNISTNPANFPSSSPSHTTTEFQIMLQSMFG